MRKSLFMLFVLLTVGCSNDFIDKHSQSNTKVLKKEMRQYEIIRVDSYHTKYRSSMRVYFLDVDTHNLIITQMRAIDGLTPKAQHTMVGAMTEYYTDSTIEKGKIVLVRIVDAGALVYNNYPDYTSQETEPDTKPEK